MPPLRGSATVVITRVGSAGRSRPDAIWPYNGWASRVAYARGSEGVGVCGLGCEIDPTPALPVDGEGERRSDGTGGGDAPTTILGFALIGFFLADRVVLFDEVLR